MSSPPTGTVTFFFTDIQGSTRLWERDAKKMQRALARHDEILKGMVEAHGGYVFKMVGDACCATFSSTPKALEAALLAQRAIFEEPWDEECKIRVRMALHTGVAEERDGDYFGPPVNRVARLLSAAHGGQVLLSLAAQELARDDLPQGARLEDLGERRLKDLFRPERVFQLTAPGLPEEFPPLRTLETYRNNLPVQPTPLVGREREVSEVCERLRNPEVRLLTLTGPGGTGKTRVGLQAVAEIIEEYEDGAFFAALATIDDPTLVAPTIARALSVAETGEKPPEETLKEYLREKELLLLLDNFEQVMEATPLLEGLLGAAPGLKVLATSRASLRVYGEHEFPVPPLELPDPRRLPPSERLTQYEAVRLFVERARAVKPDFFVTNENAPEVAEICARLDGLPLAIELASARIRLLTPKAMLSRLGSRLKLLTGGARNLPERQRTLRGAIEWSYGLLDPEEQTLFARLSVFAGGRTLEAIETVCDPEGELGAFDRLDSLLEKSLLRQEEGPEGEPRFVMLETIHEFAREKLEESGAATLKRAHAEYFLALSEEAEPELTGGPDQVTWFERLEAEHDNIRAALSWSLEVGDIQLTLQMAGALNDFWLYRGHLSEGMRWLEPALRRSSAVPPSVRAKALKAAGAILNYQGDDEQSESFLEESVALYKVSDDKWGLARAYNSLGHTAADRGEWEQAEILYGEALNLDRELGRPSHSLNNLGWAALCREDYERAAEVLREALVWARRAEDKGSVAAVNANLGWVALGRGEHPQAAALFAEALTLFRDLEDLVNIAECLEGFAGATGMRGEGERAARLYGAADSLRQYLGAPLLPGDRPRHERYLAAARSRVGAAAWEAAWEEGRSMTTEKAVAYALENIEDRT
jgi:predicted ATPase/class 3 adenylate cyclase